MIIKVKRSEIITLITDVKTLFVQIYLPYPGLRSKLIRYTLTMMYIMVLGVDGYNDDTMGIRCMSSQTLGIDSDMTALKTPMRKQFIKQVT